MIFLLTFNDNNPDYVNNYNTFLQVNNNSLHSVSGNWIYILTLNIFGLFGNYHIVVFSIGCISMYLIYKTVEYYSNCYSFCFALYMLASYVIDATQIKNFFAMSIWLYFSKYLYKAYLNENKIKNILIYIIGVLLASLCHASFAYTIVYILLLIFDEKNLLIMSGIIGISFITCSSMMGNGMLGIIRLLSKSNFIYLKFMYSKLVDYSLYFNSTIITKRSFLEIIFFIIISLIFYMLSKHNTYLQKDNSEFLKFVFKINCIIILTIPILFLSVEFYRFQRNVLILDYIAMGRMLCDKKCGFMKIYKKDLIVSIIAIIPAFYYLYIDTILWNFEDVFMNLFKLIK